MREVKLFLFAICMFLLGIYGAVMARYAESYVAALVTLIAPVVGIAAIVFAFLPVREKKKKDDTPVFPQEKEK